MCLLIEFTWYTLHTTYNKANGNISTQPAVTYLLEHVVLGNEMAGHGVQPASEDSPHDEVRKCLPTRKVHQGNIEANNDGDVHKILSTCDSSDKPIGTLHTVRQHWSGEILRLPYKEGRCFSGILHACDALDKHFGTLHTV